ncbi:MAG: hypothetical protein H7Z14_06665 [Anaerolineae bacterium]|nr:hypothetical protein [Phycisphaerae bacterium]
MDRLEPRQLLAGITLITHGYQSNGVAPQWLDRMAEVVDRRIEPQSGSLWSDVALYRLQITPAGTGVASFTRTNGPAPSTSSTGEAVIVLDWAAASDSIFGNPSTAVVAPVVASALLGAGASLGFASTSGALAVPLHLIGHSRGGSMVSEIARVLGQSGIIVDQVTTLDPFPLGPDPGPDGSADIYDNVVFADNYYENTDSFVHGDTVAGAANNGPLNLPGGASLAHSDIHTYYHGTIGRAATGDGDVTLNPAWYTSTTQRATTGYDWSRVSGGARPAAGLSSLGGGSAARLHVNTTANPLWPNVVFSSITGGTNGFVANGQNLTFNFRHQTHNTSTEIDFYLDTDTNVFNGFHRTVGAAPSNTLLDTGATPNSLPGSTNFLWSTANTTPGAYYVHALITNGAGKVRVTTFPQQLFVTAAGIETTTKRWSDDTANHDFAEPRNWSPGGAPTASDRVAIGFGTTNIATTSSVQSIDLSGVAVVTSNATQRLASLALADSSGFNLAGGGNKILVTQRLALHESAKLDLFDNDLLIDYSTASPLAASQTQIASGALFSSTAQSNPLTNTTLGAIQSSDYLTIYGPGATFAGEPIDATAVLVKYTYHGDTDFNGVVDFDDYSRADAGFNNNRTGWINGDFDYNGIVDFDDYSLIDRAFNTQLAALRPALIQKPKPMRAGFA